MAQRWIVALGIGVVITAGLSWMVIQGGRSPQWWITRFQQTEGAAGHAWTQGPLRAGDIDVLIGLLRHADADVRRGSARTLRWHEPNRRPPTRAIEPLGARLADPAEDVEVRIAAAEALGTLGPDAAPILSAALDGTEDNLLWNVLGAIGDLGEDGASATVAVCGKLHHPKGMMRARALETIARIGPPATAGASNAVAELLRSEKHDGVRLYAIYALGCLGEGAAEHTRLLIRCLEKGEYVDLAVQSLAAMRPGADALLNKALASSDDTVRAAARRALDRDPRSRDGWITPDIDFSRWD